MAASAYLTYLDGRVEIPEDLQREWRLTGGERLQVIRTAESSSRIMSELSKDIKQIDWRVFEGCLADLDLDLNGDLEKERLREVELDARL